MIVDDIDREILEYFSMEEPWHIACGELIGDDGEPGDLPERVERLWRGGAVAITPALGTTQEPTAANLRRDAENNAWHVGDKTRDQPWWDLVTTSLGNELLEGVLHR